MMFFFKKKPWSVHLCITQTMTEVELLQFSELDSSQLSVWDLKRTVVWDIFLNKHHCCVRDTCGNGARLLFSLFLSVLLLVQEGAVWLDSRSQWSAGGSYWDPPANWADSVIAAVSGLKKNSTYITIVNSLITLNENKIGAITTESKLHDFEAMSTLQNAECILSMKLRWVDLIK